MLANTEKLSVSDLIRNERVRFKAVFKAFALSMAIGLSGQATGENVVIFSHDAPSAEELGNLLFPESDANKPKTRSIEMDLSAGPKTRSIVFSKPSAKTEQPNESRPESFGLLIKFAFDSTKIVPDSRPFVDEVGKMLKLERLADEKILIEGHADAKGEAVYNLALSTKRAEAIKDYLVRYHMIEPSRMQTEGKGEMQLLADRDPFDPLNRRVQFYRVQ